MDAAPVGGCCTRLAPEHIHTHKSTRIWRRAVVLKGVCIFYPLCEGSPGSASNRRRLPSNRRRLPPTVDVGLTDACSFVFVALRGRPACPACAARWMVLCMWYLHHRSGHQHPDTQTCCAMLMPRRIATAGHMLRTKRLRGSIRQERAANRRAVVSGHCTRPSLPFGRRPLAHVRTDGRARHVLCEQLWFCRRQSAAN